MSDTVLTPLPPISRSASISITPAQNGGYVVAVERGQGFVPQAYAAFTNAADLLAGLAEIYAPASPQIKRHQAGE